MAYQYFIQFVSGMHTGSDNFVCNSQNREILEKTFEGELLNRTGTTTFTK